LTHFNLYDILFSEDQKSWPNDFGELCILWKVFPCSDRRFVSYEDAERQWADMHAITGKPILKQSSTGAVAHSIAPFSYPATDFAIFPTAIFPKTGAFLE